MLITRLKVYFETAHSAKEILSEMSATWNVITYVCNLECMLDIA